MSGEPYTKAQQLARPLSAYEYLSDDALRVLDAARDSRKYSPVTREGKMIRDLLEIVDALATGFYVADRRRTRWQTRALDAEQKVCELVQAREQAQGETP